MEEFIIHGTKTGRQRDGKSSSVVHHAYIVQGVVDGDVVRKQAWARLTDLRTGPEITIVHDHSYGNGCSTKCVRYHICVTTNEPGAHSIATHCPTTEDVTL